MKNFIHNKSILSYSLPVLGTILGLVAFMVPFFVLGGSQGKTTDYVFGSYRSGDSPVYFTALTFLCLAAMLFEAQGQAADPRRAALLGVLVAVNSALRFIEVAVPGPGGFSPIFFLIILAGYVFGMQFGFLMGALTLFVSALATGGVGPWLPAQMIVAGWVGMSAPALRPLVHILPGNTRKTEIVALAIFGVLWGLLYGAIMNLWAWPFLAGPADQSWTPGIDSLETLRRYGIYYLATSLAWDLARSAGNVLFITAFGTPTLTILRRFQQRFSFQLNDAPQQEAV
jgi:energy-coupling factor transport system substrate-specific component